MKVFAGNCFLFLAGMHWERCLSDTDLNIGVIPKEPTFLSRSICAFNIDLTGLDGSSLNSFVG